MALFKSKKDKNISKQTKSDKVKEMPERGSVGEVSVASTERSVDVIFRPRITEKATDEQQRGVYVFEVAPYATKALIKRSFVQIYKMVPRKINIVKNPAKKLFIRGKVGRKPAVKKAYVYLKEGDRIELV